MVWLTYVRMYTIPCGRRPDWEAAKALLGEYLTGEKSPESKPLEPDTIDRLRYAIEHPHATGLRAFANLGVSHYLAVGDELAPPTALDVFLEVDETGILEAAGFESVATGMPEDLRPDKFSPAGGQR